MIALYFVFWPRSWRQPETWLSHVDVVAVTSAQEWLFLMPRRRRFSVAVERENAGIDAAFAEMLAGASMVLRMEGQKAGPVHPPIAPLTCASIAGHIAGVRAWTPRGLQRKLLKNGAEVIHVAPQGRSRSHGNA